MAAAAKKKKKARSRAEKLKSPDFLALPGWHITNTDDSVVGHYTLSIAMDDPQPQQCLKERGCHEAGPPRRYGTTTLHIRDLPMHGRFVDLRIRRQRFQCMQCGAVSASVMHGNGLGPDIHEYFRVTRRLFDYIYRQTANQTFIYIAREVGLSDISVRRIFESQRPLTSRDTEITAPRILGIDDKHIKGEWYTIFCDIEKRILLDFYKDKDFSIYENKKVEGLHPFFQRMHGKHDEIRVVCQDMSSEYRVFVRNHLPKAFIVVDKFHVLMRSTRALESVYAHVKKQLHIECVKMISGTEGIFIEDEILAAETKIKEFGALRKAFLATKPEKDLRSRLDWWMTAYPELRKVHAARGKFFGFYSQTSRSTAEEFYKNWLSELDHEILPYFAELRTCMGGSFKNEILNYFNCRVTNGFVEALNGQIERADSMGRRSHYETLRQKLLLAYGPNKITPGKFRRTRRGGAATKTVKAEGLQQRKSLTRKRLRRLKKKEPRKPIEIIPIDDPQGKLDFPEVMTNVSGSPSPIDG